MNILLIGSGARENAIAKALTKHQSPNLFNIASHHNPGIVSIAKEIAIIPMHDVEVIVNYAKQKEIDWVFIGPEKPLELGLSDALWQANIPVIGPTKKLAQIETSKGFARDLMRTHQIEGLPFYQRFNHYSPEVAKCLHRLNNKFVIKADGLMSGKGVKVAGEHLNSQEEALRYCQSLSDGFVIEEKLVGPEFSLISFCDGKHLVHMPAVQDYKRLYAGNNGPNTGGMGAYTLANHRLPFLTQKDIKKAQHINEATIQALQHQIKQNYIGFLYGSFMKTAEGIYVIEFNARLGDPEAINLLALLESDLVAHCEAMIHGNLESSSVYFSNKASVSKYIVPLEYPNVPSKLQYLRPPKDLGLASLYCASVEIDNTSYKLLGARALALLSTDPQLAFAEQIVENTIAQIEGSFHWRQDIAKKVEPIVKRARIAVLGSTRGSNLLPLIAKLKALELCADVVVVVSDIEHSGIITKAKMHGLSTIYTPKKKPSSAHDYGKALIDALAPYQIDIVVLLGFMRILPKNFIDVWPQRIINVHPSLLPHHARLKDLAVHHAVLEAKEERTGCTVHLVNEIVDGGPILIQKSCTVDKADTPQSLKEKVQSMEPDALAKAIQSCIN